jgi:DNA-binding transcriptional LysR family regulator
VIARHGTPMRRLWEKLFRDAGIDPPAAPVTCASVLAIRALLLEGDYLTLLSPDQIARDVESGLITPIGGPLPGTSRPIGITTRAGWQPTALQAEFLREVERA